MLEKHLIKHCAPTLASLKIGSLFSFKCSKADDIESYVSEWNEKLSSRGIKVRMLRRTDKRALIYVYRASALHSTLSDSEVREFLTKYGYEPSDLCAGCLSDCCSIDNCLDRLERRVNEGSSSAFPHEIGLFLGYPLSDVVGFIKHAGRDCKYVGIWKVYGDVSSARKEFAKYSKCSDVYNKLWKSGRRSIMQLTVAG